MTKLTLPGKWGLILLAVWLIAMGVLPLLDMGATITTVMHVLAIAAGVLILLDR